MNRRKTGATVVIAALAAIGLTLPGTAAATATRSYTPLIGVQNTSTIVDVSATASGSTDTVSWGDLVDAVSWGD